MARGNPPIHPALLHALAHLDAESRDAAIAQGSTRLAIYGTLAPGRENHHVVASITPQSWNAATLHARLIQDACDDQFPGVIIDPCAPTIPVSVLESPQLPKHWERLDRFEGPAYRRTLAPINLDRGAIVAACVYEIHPNRAPSALDRTSHDARPGLRSNDASTRTPNNPDGAAP